MTSGEVTAVSVEPGVTGRHELVVSGMDVAHRLLRGKVLVPMHWGLVALAYHSWTEPIERVLAAAQGGDTVVIPRPGQSIEPEAPPARERWWPELPWDTAAQHPIVSTKMD